MVRDKKNRENKGVTLVALVVTIVVMLILAGTTILTGVFNIGKTKEQVEKSELQMVQHAAMQQYVIYQKTNNSAELKGVVTGQSTLIALEAELGITLKSKDSYYTLDPTALKQIDVKSAKDTYIVNYKTGEVINYTKKKTESGDPLYIAEEVTQVGTKTKEGYAKEGLILHYDGINNTENGHDDKVTIWKDLSGNNRDGILKNFQNTSESGWKSNYLQLDGNDDGIYLEGKLIDMYKKDVTIELIVNFDGNDSRDIIIGNHPNANATSIERGGGPGGTELKGRFYWNTGIVDVTTKEIYTLNKDMMIGYRMNKQKNSMGFLLDGQELEKITYNEFSQNYNFTNAWIGRDDRTGGTCLRGRLYSVRIYDRALSDTEIAQNYEVDKNRFNL